MNGSRNIALKIDYLVLDGINISQRDRPTLQTAVETELTRLLSEDGLNRHTNIALREVPANQIQLPGDNNPAQLGRRIARSVYGGMNR